MKKILVIPLIVTLLIFASYKGYSQAVAACQTMEQQQAAYNRSKASSIAVRDTASQQLQCHYNQLATYYQQLDKDNQQKAKDIQQIAKDKQQIDYDKQQTIRDAECVKRETQCIARELQCSNRERNCNEREIEQNLRELELDLREDALVECDLQELIDLIPEIENGTCAPERIVEKIKKHRDHRNHSGGADGTNPGGGGNENGYENPHN